MVAKQLTADWKWAAKKLGIPLRTASKAIHDAKESAGRKGNDNVLIDPDSGDILAPEHHEIIGNLRG